MPDHNKITSFDANTRRVTLAQYGLVILMTCVGLWYSLVGGRAESFIYPLCLALVALFIWSGWSWKYATGELFDPYMLFFVAAFMFNGSIAILEIFHLRPDNQVVSPLWDEISSVLKLKSLYLVTIGLATFHLGALLSLMLGKHSSAQFFSRQPSPQFTPQSLRFVGWVFLLISFLPTVFILQNQISIVMASGYFALFEQDVGTGIYSIPLILSYFIYPGTMFLLAGSKGRKKEIGISAVTIVLYSLIALFLGHRQRFEPLIAYVWLWDRIVAPIPRKVLLSSGAITLFVIFPLVAVTRNLPGQERLSSDLLLNSFLGLNNAFVATISEMGGSIATVAYTIELVPSTRNFDWGMGYLNSLYVLIPNFFWKVNPVISTSVAVWLIWAKDPVIAARGGGLGFSFIAEAYLNFGWFGAPLVLGIMGFLYGKFNLWAIKANDPAKLAMITSFLSFAFHFTRGQIAEYVFRPLVWYALLPYLAVKIIDRLASRSSSKDVVTLTPQKVK